jgi:hypothetical protein
MEECQDICLNAEAQLDEISKRMGFEFMVWLSTPDHEIELFVVEKETTPVPPTPPLST